MVDMFAHDSVAGAHIGCLAVTGSILGHIAAVVTQCVSPWAPTDPLPPRSEGFGPCFLSDNYAQHGALRAVSVWAISHVAQQRSRCGSQFVDSM